MGESSVVIFSLLTDAFEACLHSGKTSIPEVGEHLFVQHFVVEVVQELEHLLLDVAWVVF